MGLIITPDVYMASLQQLELPDLLEDLTGLVHWKIVGYFLKIDIAKLNEIQKDHGTDCQRAKLEMLNVRMNILLRVEDLIGALNDAGEREIAEAMEKKHGVVDCKERPKRGFAEIKKILNCCRNLHGHIPRKYGRNSHLYTFVMCSLLSISAAIKILRDALSEFFLIFLPKCLPYQWPEENYLKPVEPVFYKETQPGIKVSNTTQSITLTELANILEHSPVVVKGMVGSGKSHFVHQLANLWAKGDLLQQFSLLLLLSLDSNPALHHLKDLSRLIQIYLPIDESSSLLQEIADEVIDITNNFKILIIIDGWSESVAEGSLVSQVVKRRLLSSASLLITCRPGVHFELDRYNYCTFSLLPLNLHQIMSSQSLCSKSIYPELRSICEIPYFMNSLVSICKTTADLCPTLSTVLRFLLECFLKQCSSRLDISRETLYDFLCKAAAVIDESKYQKIPANEMKELCNTHDLQLHTVSSIGVFVTSTEHSFPVATTFYHFLPDSLRVFLHAKEAAKNEQHRLTLESACSTFGQLVCGCNGLNSTDKQLQLFKDFDIHNPAIVLGVFRCIFEAQSVSSAKHVAMLLNRKINFRQIHLSPGDCFALNYVVTQSGGKEEALWNILLQDCDLTNEHIFALFAKDFPIITHRRLANSLEALE